MHNHRIHLQHVKCAWLRGQIIQDATVGMTGLSAITTHLISQGRDKTMTNDTTPGTEPDLTPTELGERLLWEMCTSVNDFHALAVTDAKLLPHLGFKDPEGRMLGIPAMLDDVRH